MMSIDIPGGPELELNHLVLDYNGTLARDGKLLAGLTPLFAALENHLTLHVVTADTHGSVRQQLTGISCELHILGAEQQDQAKCDYITALGCDHVVAIGNGRNDVLMLKEAALGIAVMQEEGMAALLVTAADVVCTSLHDGLGLLVNPARLQATLRN